MSQISTGFVEVQPGLHLYYRILGTEGPVAVCCNGIGVSTFFWKGVAAHLRQSCRVLLWDYRGHGRSTSPAPVDSADMSIGACADDLASLLTALDLTEPALFLGHSMGCQVILEFHKRYPERVKALIPLFGTYGRPLDTFYDFSGSGPVLRAIASKARSSSRLQRRLLLPLYASPLAFSVSKLSGAVDPYLAMKQDVERYLEHLTYMDARLFFRMVSAISEHDLSAHLPEICVPTLIFGGTKDRFTPVHRARSMAQKIPGAELALIADGSHAAIVEYPELINHRIDRFLSEHALV